MLLGANETLEWCNSFVLAPKVNGKIRLCLDSARLNRVLIRPVHRDPTLDDILPMLASIKYLTLFDASSKFHNLKLG